MALAWRRSFALWIAATSLQLLGTPADMQALAVIRNNGHARTAAAKEIHSNVIQIQTWCFRENLSAFHIYLCAYHDCVQTLPIGFCNTAWHCTSSLCSTHSMLSYLGVKMEAHPTTHLSEAERSFQAAFKACYVVLNVLEFTPIVCILIPLPFGLTAYHRTILTKALALARTLTCFTEIPQRLGHTMSRLGIYSLCVK